MRKDNIWKKYATDYDMLCSLSAYRDLLLQIERNIGKYAGNFKTIMEIGVGTGNVMEKICRKWPCVKYIGIDSNIEMINVAKIKANNSANQKLICLDGAEFSKVQEHDVDVYLMNNVLYTIDKKEELLKDIYRQMSPHSVFILSDPVPPEDYKYRSIISKDLKTIPGFIKLFKCLPGFARIYRINKLIDKKYKRLNKEDYLLLFRRIGFKVISYESSYAGQANMFVMKK